MRRRTVLASGLAMVALAGCSNNWSVAYEQGLDSSITRAWRLNDVVIFVPDELTVSNDNTFVPNADIVWHGDPYGDRKAQVSSILDEGISRGASVLRGRRPVNIVVSLRQFHSVTPAAVARAPSAVHNIEFIIEVRDAATGQTLNAPELISADLEAYVGAAAVTAAINGETQRKRIVTHLDAVTRGWLGLGDDQRRVFHSLGR